MNPLVSICIPTYKQTFLLKENLDSICAQSYQNIEVLVSDDTPDDAVKNLVQMYVGRLPLSYCKNSPSLGSPANWNAVLQKAEGEFVLLLHHDDQFARPDSLALLLQPFLNNSAVDFSFGRNESIERLAKGKAFPSNYFNRYYHDPSLLVARNTLGAPSNVLLRRTAVQPYDKRFKWIVDVECYYRLFKSGKRFAYTDQNLIKTGRHEGQITNECLTDSGILLYENLTFAIEKIRKVKSLVVFDFYWRLLRNNNVRSLSALRASGIEEAKVPSFIRTIIKAQNKVPPKALRIGIVSKLLMAAAYAFV